MFEDFCNIVANYTSEDFENWAVGIGTILFGVGTIMLGGAALLALPKISQRYKDPEIITLYQKVVYRMYRQVEASPQGMPFALPEDVEQLTNLLVNRFPEIGSKDDADKLMDDLMLDDYFKTVQGNATVLRTAKWDPKDRTKDVDPTIEDLPSDED